jgi:hypothetical protein
LAAAAKFARGEVLVFTEAHCLPCLDFLDQATQVFIENPAWAGFSGRSIPMTHNLLSEIEAEMYVRDIQRNLETHPWLKVLDQCFVVRASAYRASGGIEPEYGHFAEWLLAARLHRCGQLIGYDPRPAIQHYYCGDLVELEEFTYDFCRGQIRFSHRSATDPCGDLFEEVPLWADRLRFNRSAARCMVRMLRRDALRLMKHRIFNRRESDDEFRVLDWPLSTAVKWLSHLAIPLDWRIRFCQQQIRRLRRLTQKKLDCGDRPAATQAFGELMKACSTVGFLSYICETQDDCTFELASSEPTRGSEWSSGIRQSIPTLGFQAIENHQRENFRWSEPATMVKLPPLFGDWTVRIDWLRILTIEQQSQVRFYVNEQLVPRDQVRHIQDRTEIQLKRSEGTDIRLAWVVPQFISAGDNRRLGRPVRQISWIECGDPKASCSNVASAAKPHRPMATYFLHVPKCAGTSTRLVLSNATPASSVLASKEPMFYYARQLHEGKYLFDDYEFAAGHFGWDLLAKVTDRPWQVLTLVREPFRRLQSKFIYFQQMKRLPVQLTFESWLENELQPPDSTISYFLPDMLEQGARGAAEVAALIRPRLDEAICNLRRCVVGLQESLEASLNLFADAWPCLLPPLAPRVNVTIDRTQPTINPGSASPAISEILQLESNFFQEAVRLFHLQHSALKQRTKEALQREVTTDQELREYLRDRYLARVGIDNTFNQSDDMSSTYRWSAADRYLGTNLFDRERHSGQWLRWTGPEPVTEFLLPVPCNIDYRLTIQLHMATPPAHGIGASLQIDGQPVPLVVEWSPQSFRMEAIVDASLFPNRRGRFAKIALRHPLIREANAFRQIGLALLSIEAAPMLDGAINLLHNQVLDQTTVSQKI